ncbi:hypothetical protein O181_104868 [Austropuccinia psidii MF-1]|uniref:Integrase catalytic domain-containing protein n=1 Tax=Austropuccinia psidii MF-1 TaxID=1389203 RepID=A0A9Q3JN22_9BASI|nr:hypothetical protein [Austropuccinia psidii MF-1]
MKNILHEFPDSVISGNLSEDRTLERVKTFSWWPNWRKDIAEYGQACNKFQKENRATGKKIGMMIQIQEPKSPCKIFHMDWVTSLPPGGDRSFNACLVLFERVISHTGLIQNIISDRDPKFTSALWKNIHNLFGTKLSFSTAYNPQTDGLAEIIMQTLEKIIRRFCAYGLELKDSRDFTQDWCTLI